MRFTEITAVTLTDSVVEQIRTMIIRQELQVGDHLPSERRLCELLNVSRTVVREANNRLAEMGIITRKPGRASVVEGINKPLRRAMDFLVTSGETNMGNVIEIRRVLETEAARQAAARAADDQIAAMRKALLDFEEHKGPEEDQRFHMAIANAKGNPLFAFVLEALIDLVNGLRRKTLAFEEGVKLACLTHRGVFEAIIAHDEEQAVVMIRRHLDHAEALLKSSIKS